MFEIWCHSSRIDIGESMTVPDDIKGSKWQTIVAGAVAGAVSRTCTSPMDRIKILLQVSKIF